MIIVVDTETTHYKPQLAHVIEIGAVAENGDTFENLCNPGVDLARYQQALHINGISEDEVYSAPDIKVVSEDLRAWLERYSGIKLAGYNSNHYDAPILAREPWMVPIDLWQYDVMQMAIGPMDEAGVLPHHSYYGTPKWPKLSEAERFFGIRRQGNAHRALSDAQATLEILQLLTTGKGRGETICGMNEEDPYLCPYSMYHEDDGCYLCCLRFQCQWKKVVHPIKEE